MFIAGMLRDAGYSEETIRVVLRRKPLRRTDMGPAPEPTPSPLSKLGFQAGDKPLVTAHLANYRLDLKMVWTGAGAAWKLSDSQSFGTFVLTLAGAALGLAIRTFSDIETSVVDCIRKTGDLPMTTTDAFAATRECMAEKGIALDEIRFEQTLTALNRFRIFDLRDGRIHLCQTIVRLGRSA
ncbi:MAG: hypothetical protein WBA25_18395 [Jannaschia sp.]